jgi:hypothetical protein
VADGRTESYSIGPVGRRLSLGLALPRGPNECFFFPPTGRSEDGNKTNLRNGVLINKKYTMEKAIKNNYVHCVTHRQTPVSIMFDATDNATGREVYNSGLHK